MKYNSLRLYVSATLHQYFRPAESPLNHICRTFQLTNPTPALNDTFYERPFVQPFYPPNVTCHFPSVRLKKTSTCNDKCVWQIRRKTLASYSLNIASKNITLTAKHWTTIRGPHLRVVRSNNVPNRVGVSLLLNLRTEADPASETSWV